MTEYWAEISRHPNAEVSNLGNVRYKEEIHLHGLTKRTRPKKLGGWGYLQVLLNEKTESIHVLVAEAFVGPKPDGCEVDHIDGNKKNNVYTNLQYLKHADNVLKSNCGRVARFSEGELWLMRRLANAKIPQTVIAKMFKCTQSMVSHVKNDIDWPCKETSL